jgi:hypothetical protein
MVFLPVSTETLSPRGYRHSPIPALKKKPTMNEWLSLLQNSSVGNSIDLAINRSFMNFA